MYGLQLTEAENTTAFDWQLKTVGHSFGVALQAAVGVEGALMKCKQGFHKRILLRFVAVVFHSIFARRDDPACLTVCK